MKKQLMRIEDNQGNGLSNYNYYNSEYECIYDWIISDVKVLKDYKNFKKETPIEDVYEFLYHYYGYTLHIDDVGQHAQ